MKKRLLSRVRFGGGGFTLIELLVVIVIIGIIATITIVELFNTVSKTRDTQRVADISQMQKALEIYKNDNNVYPTYATSGMSMIGSNGQTYMAKIPTAPGTPDGDCTTDSYTYSSSNNGTNYSILYCLGGAVQSAGPNNCTAAPGEVCPHIYTLRETGPGGGIIFYDDVTDGFDNIPGYRYLEASTEDLYTTGKWQNSGTLARIGTSPYLGRGLENTNAIVAILGTDTSNAAGLARTYNGGGKTDWFLPSEDELKMMYGNLKRGTYDEYGVAYTPVGNLNSNYWSSSENYDISAMLCYFSGGSCYSTSKSSTGGKVRAIRAF